MIEARWSKDGGMGSPRVVADQAERDQAVVVRHVVGRRTVLAVRGEIDLASVDALAAAVDAAVAAGAAELWIDLTDTEFMDSTGLHLMLDTRRRVQALNRRLAIVCPPGFVRKVFEVAGVAGQLPVFDDRAAAHRAG